MPVISPVRPGARLFYKYASPEAALAILGSRSFRFSSPLIFNDPFDIQVGLHFDFDVAALPSRIIDRVEELVNAEAEPVVDLSDPWGQFVILARRKFHGHRFPRRDLERFSLPGLSGIADEISRTQRSYQEHWQAALLPCIRVFCVSEDRDNLLMWAHYAKDHKGVVFELKSLPDEDNAISVAEPVVYLDCPPTFFTEAEWIEEILSLKRLDVDRLARRYVCAKSSQWAYEREWRVWVPFPLVSDNPWLDLPILSSEFSAIYIGCCAEQSFVNQVSDLARSAFPAVRLYKANKARDRYGLDYSAL